MSSKYDGRYDNIISSTAEKYNIPTEIWQSVVKVESNFEAYAVSDKGAKGLAQLMPLIYKKNEFGDHIDPFNPEQNLERGAQLLSSEFKRYGNWQDALAHYNAGFKIERGRGYAQDVLDNARKLGYGGEESDVVTSSVMQKTLEVISKTPLGKFSEWFGGTVKGAGEKAGSAASEAFWAIVEKIFGEQAVAALKNLTITGLFAWIVAAVLLFLAIIKLING